MDAIALFDDVLVAAQDAGLHLQKGRVLSAIRATQQIVTYANRGKEILRRARD